MKRCDTAEAKDAVAPLAKKQKAAFTQALYVNKHLTDGLAVKIVVDPNAVVEMHGAKWFEVLRRSAPDVPADLFAHFDLKSKKWLVPAQQPFCSVVWSFSESAWSKAHKRMSGVHYRAFYKAVADDAPAAYTNIYSKFRPKRGVWTTGKAGEGPHEAVLEHFALEELASSVQKKLAGQMAPAHRVCCVCYTSNAEPKTEVVVFDMTTRFAVALDRHSFKTNKEYCRTHWFTRRSLFRLHKPDQRNELRYCLWTFTEKYDAPPTDVPWLVCDEPGLFPSPRATFTLLPQSVCAALEHWTVVNEPLAIYSVKMNGKKVDYLVSLDLEAERFISTRIRVDGELVETRVVRVLQRGKKPQKSRVQLRFPSAVLESSLSFYQRVKVDSQRLFEEMVDPKSGSVRLPRHFVQAFPLVETDGVAPRLVAVKSDDAIATAAVQLLQDSFLLGLHSSAQPSEIAQSFDLNRIRDVAVHACVNPVKAGLFVQYATAVARDLKTDGELEAGRLNLATCFHGTVHEAAEDIATSSFGLLANAPARNGKAFGHGLYVSRVSSQYCVNYCAGRTSRRSMLLCVAALGVSQKVDRSTTRLRLRSSPPGKMCSFHSGWAGTSSPNVYTLFNEAAVLPLARVEFTLCPATANN